MNVNTIFTYWTLCDVVGSSSVKNFLVVTTEIVLNRLSYTELFWKVVCESASSCLPSSIGHVRIINECKKDRERERKTKWHEEKGNMKGGNGKSLVLLRLPSFFFSLSLSFAVQHEKNIIKKGCNKNEGE